MQRRDLFKAAAVAVVPLPLLGPAASEFYITPKTVVVKHFVHDEFIVEAQRTPGESDEELMNRITERLAAATNIPVHYLKGQSNAR